MAGLASAATEHASGGVWGRWEGTSATHHCILGDPTPGDQSHVPTYDLQSQLEEGNAALLAEASPVLDLLATDALSAQPAQVRLTLHACCAPCRPPPAMCWLGPWCCKHLQPLWPVGRGLAS